MHLPSYPLPLLSNPNLSYTILTSPIQYYPILYPAFIASYPILYLSIL